MIDFPDTRDSLLAQVKDPRNQEAWGQFARIYRPVIYRIAVGKGLQDADAQDLAQQVLIAVASAIPDWERTGEATRFRNWLARVTKHAVINALTRRPRDAAQGGSSVNDLLNELPDGDEATEELIALEYRREVYLRATDAVRVDIRDETWAAFEMTVIDGVGIEAAARQLGKSVGTVYAARSRVMRRLREAVRQIEEMER